MNEQDVPSPIDLCDPRDALEWERTAQERPGRAEVFRAIGRELEALGEDDHDLVVLELGSGPGFLADYLLNALPSVRLTLLDFSGPMHKLARTRLGARVARVTQVERSFKEPGWSQGLGLFDAVVTNQAVHELRHKRHATQLHAAVKGVLKPRAPYLVSDHFCGEGGSQDHQLNMTVAEHRAALLRAGFSEVQQVITAGSLVLHRAT
jgi:cyclopropane fatty-acyl-phospholipid synthase-like methyltransferase